MEHRMRRGVSFHALPSNSSGDENYLNTSLQDVNAEAGKVNKSQRRRRRTKTRKRIISDSLCDDMPSYSNTCESFLSLGNGSHNSFCKRESDCKRLVDESNSCEQAGPFNEEPILSSSFPEIQVKNAKSKSGGRVLSPTESTCFKTLITPDSVSDGTVPDIDNPSKSFTYDKPNTIPLERSSLDTAPESATNNSLQIAPDTGRISTTFSVSSLDASSPPQNLHQKTLNSLELRQRYVYYNGQESGKDPSLMGNDGISEISGATPSSEQNRNSLPKRLGLRTLFPGVPGRPSVEVLDWERLISDSSVGVLSSELSPWQYIVKELTAGSSLRSTTSAGDEKKRNHVYNTMFHVPWRCELLIDTGFFLCLDSFLSLFTIMPARTVLFLGKRIVNWRQFRRPFADELSDFWCILVMVLGVALLQQADISYIYHSIRFQSSIKLYVVYNVLEIFDKLCQSFGGDVLEVLFDSAMAVSSCSSEQLLLETLRFLLDQTIAILCFMLHCLIILSQAITVSAAINPTNNALMMLLISNNFAEIKSNVFKRMTKDNLHKVAYHDVVERFHITTCLCFVFAQHVMVAEGNWVKRFMFNAVMIVACEILIDIIKHAFLAKFNDIKPVAYSDFLQALCKQILHISSHEEEKRLIFVPIAPACVVIRVLIPLYAAYISRSSIWWRLITTIMLGMGTYALLCICKVIVGIGLQMYARWYLERCQRNRKHFHAD